MKNIKNKYLNLNDLKHDKNRHLNTAPINDNKMSRKIIILIKFSKI